MGKLRRHYPDIAPSGPTFSRGIRSGNMLFLSGITARGPSQGGPLMEQLRVVLDRITRIVAEEGGGPSDIVKLTTFVTDIGDWRAHSQDSQALMEEFFKGTYPANSLVAIDALADDGLDVEIEAIAIID